MSITRIIKDRNGNTRHDVTVEVASDGYVSLRRCHFESYIAFTREEAEELLTFLDVALGDNE